MKKLFVLLSLLLGLTAVETFAQTQVHGVETRRIIYDGPGYGGRNGTSKYYGWEITNHNSITISVEIELWCHDDDNKIVKTQDIILKRGESYVFKREEHVSTWVNGGYSNYPISNYYVKYKAYKLE